MDIHANSKDVSYYKLADNVTINKYENSSLIAISGLINEKKKIPAPPR